MQDDIKKRVKQREDMFLRRLFGMLAKMAKADGKVDAWETHAAEGAFARFPRAAARRKFCVRVFNESKKSRISLYRQAWEFSNKWGASSSDCLAVYELLWDIACSTGFLKPVHKSNLSGICKYLNLPEAYFNIYVPGRSANGRIPIKRQKRKRSGQSVSRPMNGRGPTSRRPVQNPRFRKPTNRSDAPATPTMPPSAAPTASRPRSATRTSSAPPARLRGVLRRLRSRWRGSTMPGTRSAGQEGCDDILSIGG